MELTNEQKQELTNLKKWLEEVYKPWYELNKTVSTSESNPGTPPPPPPGTKP